MITERLLRSHGSYKGGPTGLRSTFPWLVNSSRNIESFFALCARANNLFQASVLSSAVPLSVNYVGYRVGRHHKAGADVKGTTQLPQAHRLLSRTSQAMGTTGSQTLWYRHCVK